MRNYQVCFIAAGMGGGTGTGASPVIAQIARDLGVLAIAVVTTPFQFEGSRRMRSAEAGLRALQGVAHSTVIIRNQNLVNISKDRTTFEEAFHLADQNLYSAIRGVLCLLSQRSLASHSPLDVRLQLQRMGPAFVGEAMATGSRRAVSAAEHALVNPLLDGDIIAEAKTAFLSVISGPDLSVEELRAILHCVKGKLPSDAQIKFAATSSQDMHDAVSVIIIASGNIANESISSSASVSPMPSPSRPQRTHGVFLNYRRSDSDLWADLLYSKLVDRIPKDAIFMDVDARIPLGVQWSLWIDDRVADCNIMLVLIGHNWTREFARRSTLGQPDIVLHEIERALARRIPIVPVLLSDAAFPNLAEVPESIRALFGHQAARLERRSLQDDLDALVKGVIETLELTGNLSAR